MGRTSIYVRDDERPRALWLRDLSGKQPRYRGRIISHPDYELEPTVEHTSQPGVTVVESRGREAEIFGLPRGVDASAGFEFAADNALGGRDRYRKADCFILKSHFGPNIANPNALGKRCHTVCVRGADNPDARRISVALLFLGFLVNLPASGTRWRAYALGSELFVLIKEKRVNRPPMALALIGAGYSPNALVTAAGKDTRGRDGAGGPEDWLPFAILCAQRFADIEVYEAAPYPEMLARAGLKNRLTVWGARGVTATRHAIRDWENALSAADFEGWPREAGRGWFRRERQDGASAKLKGASR